MCALSSGHFRRSNSLRLHKPSTRLLYDMADRGCNVGFAPQSDMIGRDDL
jgi:hypothetical protein